MAMTPEERNRMEQLERTVEALSQVQDVAFIENIRRRLDFESLVDAAVTNQIATTSIGQLSDVDLTGLSNNEILKYNSTSENFEPAADEIGAS